MPPIRNRSRKPRPATGSKYAPTAILDTIAVATNAAPAIPTSSYSSSSSLIHHAMDPSTDIRNQAAIAEALARARHMLQSNRAMNIKKAYAPKKDLWVK